MENQEEFCLTNEDKSRLDNLTEDELRLIDSWLLSGASLEWSKAAMVVAKAISESDRLELLEDVSDLVFASRLEQLVKIGVLDSRGNIRKLRFSEVRIAK